MFDVDGNILIPLSFGIGVFIAVFFYIVSWDTLIGKILKIISGLLLLALLINIISLFLSDARRLNAIKKVYEQEIVGTYVLDKMDSNFNESQLQIRDSVFLVMFENLAPPQIKTQKSLVRPCRPTPIYAQGCNLHNNAVLFGRTCEKKSYLAVNKL